MDEDLSECLSVVLALIIELCWDLSPLSFLMGSGYCPTLATLFKDTYSEIKGRIIVGKWAEVEIRGTVY